MNPGRLFSLLRGIFAPTQLSQGYYSLSHFQENTGAIVRQFAGFGKHPLMDVLHITAKQACLTDNLHEVTAHFYKLL